MRNKTKTLGMLLVGMALGGGGALGGTFISTHEPAYNNGNEFPGATGSLARAEGVLSLHYDFAKGGHYVGAVFELPEKPVVRALALEAEFTSETALTLRIVDSTGQCFQICLGGAPNGWERTALEVGDDWACWGGKNDHVFHQPATRFAVLAENLTKDRPGGAKGTLRVRNVAFLDAPPTAVAREPLADVPLVEALYRAGAARDDLRRTVPALEAKGLGAKSRATLATLEYFGPWLDEDVKRGFTARALREARELAALGERGAVRARAILDGREKDFPVPHYRTSKIEISHAQAIADRVWPDGHVDRGPVFLTGYGHFTTIQRELARMPALGNHILQMEIGPWTVLNPDGTFKKGSLDAFLDTVDRAAKENVAVTLLLSPHYFPHWELDRHPELKACAGGFLKYCVYAPSAKALVEKYLRTVIPLVRGKPALHSICLSNEPESHVYAKCPELRAAWPGWLAKRHGTLAAFNAKMGTGYASFEAVPMPENCRGNSPSRVLAEFRAFNTEMFAGWHAWMAGIVHELAPEIPVHAKIMINPCLVDGNATFYSVDPALFGAFSQYNGNDSYDNYRQQVSGWGDWSHGWTYMQAGYDWQRSVADLPVFNTENHIQPDRSKGYLPGAHTYTVLWQNAIHGQAATTLWCWERAYDSGRSDFNGLILERPEAFEAWAHAALDLSRLADELAPIQNLPPSVLVYWSPAAVLRGAMQEGEGLKIYRAANFLGQPLGFATDAALVSGGRPVDQARVVLLPEAVELEPDVRAGLERFAAKGGRVVRVPNLGERALARHLASSVAGWGVPDHPIARDPRTGLAAWGVETRGCRVKGRSVLSLCNHRNEPVRVRLERAGTDLVTGRAVAAEFDVPPLRPMLVLFD